MWVLAAFVALALALVIYSGMLSQLPPELAFLRPAEAPVQATQAASGAGANVEGVTAQGWIYREQAGVIEVSKHMAPIGGLATSSQPLFALLCDSQGKLLARIDTKVSTTGRLASPVRIAVAETSWSRAQGTNLLAPNAAAVYSAALTAPQVVFEISTLDAGWKRYQLATDGLAAATARFAATCKAG